MTAYKSMVIILSMIMLLTPIVLAEPCSYNSQFANMTVNPCTAESLNNNFQQDYLICNKAQAQGYLFAGALFYNEISSGKLYRWENDNNFSVSLSHATIDDKDAWYTQQGDFYEAGECKRYTITYTSIKNEGKYDLRVWADTINDWSCVLDDSCVFDYLLDPYYLVMYEKNFTGTAQMCTGDPNTLNRNVYFVSNYTGNISMFSVFITYLSDIGDMSLNASIWSGDASTMLGYSDDVYDKTEILSTGTLLNFSFSTPVAISSGTAYRLSLGCVEHGGGGEVNGLNWSYYLHEGWKMCYKSIPPGTSCDMGYGLNFELYDFFPGADTQKPNLTIDAPANNSYQQTGQANNVSVSFGYTATDDVAVDECWYINYSNDAVIGLVGCANFSVSTLYPGYYNFTVLANDTSDNVGNKTVFFWVNDSSDWIAPNVSVTSPENNSVYNLNESSYIIINLSYIVDSADTCWYKNLTSTNYFTLAGCTNTTINLSYGNYTFIVFANDSVNNVGNASSYFLINDTRIVIAEAPNETYSVTILAILFTLSMFLLIGAEIQRDATELYMGIGLLFVVVSKLMSYDILNYRELIVVFVVISAYTLHRTEKYLNS